MIDELKSVVMQEEPNDLPPYEPTLVEQLNWPCGWFFEDAGDHVIYVSDAPFEAAVEIERLRTALTQIRDMDVERSSEAWKRHSVKLKLIASAALGGENG